MHRHTSDLTGSGPVSKQTKTVAPPYRSREQIAELLQHIAAGPTGSDEITRLRNVNVLDDLAEEMIGRSHPDDIILQEKIRSHCDRLRATVSQHGPADGG